MDKTNVMRILDQKKIAYTVHALENAGGLSGLDVAEALGEDPASAFKTLVTAGVSKAYYVFIIPVAAELDLKKAARCAGEKSISMIPQKELLPLTGYVHGGCSPIGMKKVFKTFIHESASACSTVCVSAGKVGMQVELSLSDLGRVIPLRTADLTV